MQELTLKALKKRHKRIIILITECSAWIRIEEEWGGLWGRKGDISTIRLFKEVG